MPACRVEPMHLFIYLIHFWIDAVHLTITVVCTMSISVRSRDMIPTFDGQNQ